MEGRLMVLGAETGRKHFIHIHEGYYIVSTLVYIVARRRLEP